MNEQIIRILLVEDDQDDYLITRSLLSEAVEARFELEWAPSYEAGLCAMQRNDHHVYLLDYYLGDQNGLDLLHEAVQGGCRKPVIMLTGKGDYDVDMEAMKAGAADYLVKGQLNAHLLERSIRYAIESKRTEEFLRNAHHVLEVRVAERTSELADANHALKKEIGVRKQIEAALQESETLFRSLVENTSAGVVILQGATMAYANPGFLKLLDIKGAAPGGLDIFEFIHPEEREMVRERIAWRLMEEEGSDEYDLRIIRREGEIRWVNLLTSRVAYRGEAAILGTLVDITGRKQAEEILRKREFLNQLFLDSIPHASMLIRRDRTVLAANRIARELGAKVGGYCWEIFEKGELLPPEDREYILSHNGTPPAGGTRCSFCQAEKAFQGNRPLNNSELHAFGEIWDTWWVPVDEEVFLGYFINVTERRRAEAALCASEERYRLLVETMNEGLMIRDEGGLIRFANQKLCRMLGYPPEEMVGNRHFCIFDEKEAQKVDQRLRTNGVDPFETVLRRKDGKPVYASVTAKPLVDADGTVKGSFAFLTDITELSVLRQRVQLENGFEGFVGRDTLILELFDMIKQVAAFDSPVLIQGETGVGKELAAMAIHNQSSRAGMRFVPVNCAALPEGLLESELFGHVKGAFTGATRTKKGRFELADGGSIFLDEISELSPAIQVKLLRVLQERIIEPVGSEKPIRVDVRVISATNKELEKEMAAGRFRKDLYYRLCVVPIHVPPLRERPGDIPLLAEHFIQRALGNQPESNVSLSRETLAILTGHDWPGNVRELQNVVQYAIIKSRGKVIEPRHLPEALVRAKETCRLRRNRSRKIDEHTVRSALEQAEGNKVVAAHLLGISRSTLYRFIEECMGGEPG